VFTTLAIDVVMEGRMKARTGKKLKYASSLSDLA